MDNNNFLEELKEYFRTTSKEQILADWEKSQEYDKVGPTVDEFLGNTVEQVSPKRKFKKNKLSKGDKIILKISDSLYEYPQEKRIKYLGIETTIKELWSNKIDGGLCYSEKISNINTFFIEEDDGYFEWEPDNIEQIL